MPPTPSAYEQRAWDALRQHRPRRAASRGAQKVAEELAAATRAAVEQAHRVGEAVPQIGRATRAVRGKVGPLREHVPAAVSKGATQAAHGFAKAAEGTGRFLSRAGTATLTPSRVVRAHQRKGHTLDGEPLRRLDDLHTLDLEQIDQVRPHGLDLFYAGVSAAVGAGSGLVITGSQIAIPVSGGAAAAPSTGAILGALSADAAAVTMLCGRAVGHVALYYGYDPARAEEKVFHLAVVNFGTATTASAKAAAYADLSRLTQMLFRGKPWAALNETVTARLATMFAKQFNVRLTQKGLGKLVPVAGIAAGASLNWLTLEQIVDAADVAYRRRFLADKYPEQFGDEPFVVPRDDAPADAGEDTDLSVLGMLDELVVDLPETAVALADDDEEPEHDETRPSAD